MSECGTKFATALFKTSKSPTDIDECHEAALEDTGLCGRNGNCINSEGSYDCICATGSALEDGTCQCKSR